MDSAELAAYLGGKLIGRGDVTISGFAELGAAREGDVSFFAGSGTMPETHAGCLLIGEDVEPPTGEAAVIVVKDPKLAFAKVVAKLFPPRRLAGIDQSAKVAAEADVRASFIGANVVIESAAEVDADVEIHAGCYVGSGVKIGRGTRIFPNCTIYENVTIGENCTIHAGCTIGADGFGFVRDGANGYVKFPQAGSVSIGDEVEIGANSCVDRGALGVTEIGDGTKIDNLVQIAHNVKIGKRVVIAAQTGISGSTVIEDDCVIGGQVGMGDHARVLSGAVIGSQAGVLPGKIVRKGVWWGTPVQPLDDYKRQNALVKGLGRLKEEVKRLRGLIERDEGQ
ncbi:MAG: UDP-3-O-(3-hydroxymyristoyl) glucosamine N-acyltransferase [Acidobacteria bacterium OLB17]|nr:MAG: UDP-3-O-(3-hydroxymyristoyl) glucosamine N-acyltransferase [Acidobacteria bacterium OLB17]MCZ2391851.1 UDP-3-O-(3-hydroxymyristoyl)glucosamine N-acyltransferase [Acidobacteriota bacterium]